jgi:hypothetical protein
MAEIKAQLTVNSDISSYGMSINSDMTMNKADSETGLELTSGLAKRAFTVNTQVDLVTGTTAAAGQTVTATKAAKLYIKNVGSSPDKYFIIGKGTASTSTTETTIDSSGTAYYRIGRLYGGDWMLIPWDAVSATGDITIQASDATTADPMYVEYMVFFE